MTLPDDIIFIQRGWVNSNSVLILGGDGPVVVDTGHIEDAAETCALISAHINLSDIRLLVNTHCHWDHLGGNAALRAVSGAQTAVSQATAAIFAQNDRRALWLDYFAAEAVPMIVELIWQDGDRVQLGDYTFEVIATPGHAPDSIALYQPDTQLLIAADALHENDCGILNTVVHGEQVLDEAITTVEKLRMYDVRLALPGHGRMIHDVAASLDTLAARLNDFKKHPEKMARHLLRRVMMTTLLMSQPISRRALLTYALARPWPHDYAPLAGYYDPETCLHDLLEGFIHRGLVKEQGEQLISFVPR